MSQKDLLIFPYSGTAIEALDCLGSGWNCVGFVSDDDSLRGKKAYGIPVFDRAAFGEFPAAMVLAVNGSPASFLQRERIIEGLGLDEERFATVVHPRASVGPNVLLGRNVLVMAGVVLTANARIGNHVILLPNSVVHHDSSIGDHTLIGAQAVIAGNVSIGQSCYIGAAASIRNGIRVGDRVLVGMGSNVVADYADDVVLRGNPAKPVLP